MSRKGKKHVDAFTLIVVPHTEKTAFSLRIPFWIIYVSAALLLVGMIAFAFLVADRQDAHMQLAELRRSGQITMIREADLQAVIAYDQQQEEDLRRIIAQQNARATEVAREREAEAAEFQQQVAELATQLQQLEQFKADIRRIVGLDKAPSGQSTGVQPPAPRSQSTSGEETSIGPLEPLVQDRVAVNLSSRGVETTPSTPDATRAAAGLAETVVPQQWAELEKLRKEVLERVSKVEGRWSSPEQLSQELRLYDASPRNWPVYGLIMARFGYDARRISLGAHPFHKGVDIAGSVGTPMRSPQDGIVSFVGWNGSYGLTVEIQHSMGWSTLYAHLSSTPVKVGDRITKGQTIGYIGLTGLTTGPHLHYEIHLNGVPVDPMNYLGK